MADLAARLRHPLRILALGDELLRGEVIDANSPWLAARLGALGHHPDGIAQISDHGDAATEAVRRWRKEGGCLVIGGGLGPTPDDLTREGIALGLEADLAKDASAAAMIEAREARVERRFSEFTHRQALLPEGCAPIANPCGTAPAFWREGEDGGFLLVLPGVPAEYRAIAETLFPRPDTDALAANWRLAGLGEDRLAELVDDLPGRDRLGFYPSLEGHRLRVPPELDHEELARRLAPYLVSRSNEGLEQVLVRQLAERGETLAVAESCTGGLLGARVTRTPGASEVFVGGVQSYSDRVKVALLGVDPELIRAEGAVSEQVARAMAEGARERVRSDWALSITGIAGPGGERPDKPVGTLHFGLAGPEGFDTRHLHRVAGWGREDNRRYAVLQALILLWQALGERSE